MKRNISLVSALRGLIRVLPIIFLYTISFSLPSFAQEFAARHLADYGNVTVMEVTGNYDENNPDGTSNSVPRQLISSEFFKNHKDEYDFLVIFTGFDFRMATKDELGFYSHVKNDVQGIGKPLFDNSSLYGSNGRLQGTIDMGNIATKGVIPSDRNFQVTLDTLSHEILHRWSAYVRYKDANGNVSAAILGEEQAHWSYLLDTKGSLQYGNQWQDNGNGTFTSIATPKYYSPLDLYLMGMIDKSKVPPMLLIDNPNIDPTKLPEPGATITGTPRYITIGDIIAAEGERIPNAKDSQKRFKMAFIYVTAPGIFSGDALYGIENIRNGFLTRYSILTDGQGIVQVASTPKEDLPVNPGVRPPSTTPRTLPPNVDDGVKWLISSQQTDESWTDFAMTTERDTAEAVTTLQRFSAAQQQFQTGLAWLGSSAPANTDFLSRRVEATVQAGGDGGTLVQELLARRNPDGGWGSGRSFISNPTDSALAMQALARAGYAEQQVVSQAITYLKSVQNSDGGWSGGDSVSTIQPTAAVLTAFNTYRKSFSLENQIALATAFLAGKQNPDGGFGNSPSTVYDSALAIMSLQESGADREIANRGVAYLTGLQAENGSWQDSPYQTALAVRAVWQATVDPDLAIKSADITFIPEKVTSLPTNAVVSAVIWNLGRNDVPQAKVAIYDGVIVPEKKVAEQTVAFPGQSPVSVTFSVPVTDGNGHTFFVVVDPENEVKEANEHNNTGANVLFPESTYDFEVIPGGVTLSAETADIGSDITVRAVIRNNGTMTAYSTRVVFSVIDSSGSLQFAAKTLDIPAGATIFADIMWKADREGVQLPISVVVDPYNNFSELNEGNNSGEVHITINKPVFTGPNLTVDNRTISVSPALVKEGEVVRFSTSVGNDGNQSSVPVPIRFFSGNPSTGGTLIGTAVLPEINPGGAASVSTDVVFAEPGEKVIHVVADPENAMKELREDDNSGFTLIKVLALPDLEVTTENIAFSPVAPREGAPVTINVSVANSGDLPVEGVTVTISEGGTVIDSGTITSLAGKGLATLSFSYDTTGKGGLHAITATAATVVAETTTANNTAMASFGVFKKDMMLTETYFSPNGDDVKDTTTFLYSLQAPQTINIAIIDRKGNTTRTISGGDLVSTAVGSVTWDGRDDRASIVADGEYRFTATTDLGALIFDAPVVVDTNRSSIVEAIKSGNFMRNDLACKADNLSISGLHEWLPDGTGVVYLSPDGTLKKATRDGRSIQDLITDEAWQKYRKIEVITPSPDGRKIAAIVRYEDYPGGIYKDEVWLINSDGSGQILIDEAKYASLLRIQKSDNDYTGGFSLTWSPDSKNLIYVVNNYAPYNIFKANAQTNAIKLIYASPNRPRRITWSLTSSKIVVFSNDIQVLDSDGGLLQTSDILRIYANGYDQLSIKWITDDVILAEVVSNNHYYSDNEDNLTFKLDVSSGKHAIYWLEHSDPYTSAANKIFPSQYSNRAVILAKRGTYSYFYGVADEQFFLNHKLPTPQQLCPENMSWAAFSPDSNKISCVSVPYGFYYGSGWRSVYDNYWSKRPISVVDLETNKTSFIPSEGYHRGVSYLRGALWIDNEHLLVNVVYSDSVEGEDYQGLYLVNISSGEKAYVADGSLPELDDYSKQNSDNDRRYPLYQETFFYTARYDKNEAFCQAKPSASPYAKSAWTVTASSNLTAELLPLSQKYGIIFNGTASDGNFESYSIEYAPEGNTSTWFPIVPNGDRPVVNSTLTAWTPPGEGSYFVRLVVRDKAGNVAIDRKKVSWVPGGSPITGIRKSAEIISPNADGIAEAVEIFYSVLDPVYLDIRIYDDNDALVRSFAKDYPAPTEASVSWDGRDESGSIVPDGKYRIDLGLYSFFVTVDSTLPAASLEITYNPVNQTMELKGRATDRNISKWVIEYGTGDDPKDWSVLRGGTAPVWDPKQPTESVTVKTWERMWLGWLGGKKFRLTVEDIGGNKVTTTSRMVEEQLLLSAWDGLALERETVLPGSSVLEGQHLLKGVHSIRLPLERVDVLYSTFDKIKGGYEWHEVATAVPTVGGIIDVTWGIPILSDPIHEVKLKAVDVTGREFASLPLPVQQEFSLKSLDHGGTGVCEAWGVNEYFLKLSTLKLQSMEGSWSDLKVYGSPGTPVPEGEFSFSGIDWNAANGKTLRMVGVDSAGRMVTSGNLNFKRQCELAPPPPPSLPMTVMVAYPHAGCGGISGKAELAVLFDIKGYVNLKDVKYYLEKAEGSYLLGTVELAGDFSGKIVIDTRSLPEGKYTVKGVVSYASGTEMVEREAAALAQLIVDRRLPEAKITYPASGTLLACPARVIASGKEVAGIHLEGSVQDPSGVSFELYYANSASPATWMPASRPAGEQIAGATSISGELGFWALPALSDTKYLMKLVALDAAGNSACASADFSIDGATELSAITKDRNAFSPNGDGIADTLQGTVTIPETATVGIKILNFTTSAVIRTLASGIHQTAGTFTFSWDGKNDAGVTVADGKYKLSFTIIDSCGNTSVKSESVEVDNTPPLSILSYPRIGLSQSIIQISGTTTDAHFESMTLEAGQGDFPVSWVTISTASTPILNGVVGVWNASGLQGRWRVRLTATDTAGNRNVRSIPIDLVQGNTLIKGLSVTPRIVSPNGDGKSDSSVISLDLAEGTSVKVDIFNFFAENVRSYPIISGGTLPIHLEWDGKNTNGQLVADGTYSVSASASLVGDPSITQTEKVMVVVDNTPPAFTITSPQDKSVVNAPEIEITGSIADSNLFSYSITVQGTDYLKAIDSGNQVRYGYSFGKIGELKEGLYTLITEAADQSQNVTRTTRTFTVDRTPPTVSLSGINSGDL